MDKLEFIYQRHSVRQFTDATVPAADLERIISAATAAPSGKNLQNWHFVIIKNRSMIAEIARIVTAKNAQLASCLHNQENKAHLTASLAYHTVFKNAPILILVYAGPYPNVGEDLAAEGALSPDKIAAILRPHPGVQNIAAAMENLLLAAASLGYGGCWMTGPTYAAEEITQYIGFDQAGYYLAAMTPLGVPAAAALSSPSRKPLAEVMTIIE